jgi:hypothetical protein
MDLRTPHTDFFYQKPSVSADAYDKQGLQKCAQVRVERQTVQASAEVRLKRLKNSNRILRQKFQPHFNHIPFF